MHPTFHPARGQHPFRTYPEREMEQSQEQQQANAVISPTYRGTHSTFTFTVLDSHWSTLFYVIERKSINTIESSQDSSDKRFKKLKEERHLNMELIHENFSELFGSKVLCCFIKFRVTFRITKHVILM